MTECRHWYASGAELTVLVLNRQGVSRQRQRRADVRARHGTVGAGPQVYLRLHTSLNATVSNSSATGYAGIRCWLPPLQDHARR